MRLYIVRHGDAVSEKVDAARPLSREGRAIVEGIAAFLAKSDSQVARIFHSGKTRAAQTAEILAASLCEAAPPATLEGLNPLDPIETIADELDQWYEDTMIVGHLPFVGRLLAYLLGQNDEDPVPVVSFLPGTVACLGRFDDGSWTILWVLGPRLFDYALK